MKSLRSRVQGVMKVTRAKLLLLVIVRGKLNNSTSASFSKHLKSCYKKL